MSNGSRYVSLAGAWSDVEKCCVQDWADRTAAALEDADRTAAALEDAWPLWPAIETAAGLPPNESRHIAGDAVNFHCMCAVLAVVFLFAERRPISAS